MTGKATSKALKGGDGDGEAKPKKAAAGGKRKKATSEDGADDAPKAKKGRGRPKKAKSGEKVESEGESAGLMKPVWIRC